MMCLLIVEPGYRGEALETIVRHAHPRFRFRVRDTYREPEGASGAARLPDLIVAEAPCLGPRPEVAAALLRGWYPDVPVVVIGADEPAEAGAPGGDVIYVPVRWATQKISNRIRDLLARSPRPRPAEQPAPAVPDVAAAPVVSGLGLTRAELRVLSLLAGGRTNREIAQSLEKEEGTVRVQVRSILRKLRVRNRGEAIVVSSRLTSVIQAQLNDAERDPVDIACLLPHAVHRVVPAGTTLFRRGDPGDRLYLLQRGSVRLVERDVVVRGPEPLGEIGIFAPDHKRTSTAICEEETTVLEFDADRVRQAFIAHPSFAYQMIQTVASRVSADRAALPPRAKRAGDHAQHAAAP